MRVYLHPRRWRRSATVFALRYLAGRSKGEKLSPVEKQLLKIFHTMVSDPNTQLMHLVNGVFAKELVQDTPNIKAKFRLVDNSTKIVFMKDAPDGKIVVETFVSAKTVLVLNRLFDKEFAKVMLLRKEAENEFVREVFKGL